MQLDKHRKRLATEKIKSLLPGEILTINFTAPSFTGENEFQGKDEAFERSWHHHQRSKKRRKEKKSHREKKTRERSKWNKKESQSESEEDEENKVKLYLYFIDL